MRKIYTTLLFVLTAIFTVNAQYKFDYRLKLHDKASTYSESIAIKDDSSSLGTVKFDLENSLEQKIQDINISVLGKKYAVNVKTDSTGLAILNLKPGIYTFTVTGTNYNSLILKDIEVNSKFSIKYSINLGDTNAQKTAKLRCSKKLSDKQINGILTDLTNGKGESELIKCRICFLSYE